MSILLTGFIRKKRPEVSPDAFIYDRWMRLSGLSFYVLYLQFLYLTEEIGCKDEVIQFLVARGEDIVLTAFPFFISVVDIDNFLTYSHDGVHIMSIDESGHIILMRDVVYQFVNDERCLWVQTRVWFIAEQVLRIQSNGTGNGAYRH